MTEWRIGWWRVHRLVRRQPEPRRRVENLGALAQRGIRLNGCGYYFFGIRLGYKSQKSYKHAEIRVYDINPRLMWIILKIGGKKWVFFCVYGDGKEVDKEE